MALQVTESEVLERAAELPAFPKVVTDILETLDDEGATVGALVQHVERDPVITARVLSAANSAAMSQSGMGTQDVRKAVSRVGHARIREITLGVSLANFTKHCRMSAYFWEHSVSVGICALELSRLTHISADFALAAGLLHDVGQLWMAHFYPEQFQSVRADMACGTRDINDVEREHFGLDHCTIGELLARHWSLPESVVAAIRLHHAPDEGADDGLVAVTHVAEVLSNALDLTGRLDNAVANVSQAACERIGIDWSSDLGPLFGRIEARTEYACQVFR